MEGELHKGFKREEADSPSLPQGVNYLLVIGINEYVNCGKLKNARGDAEDFAALLKDHYEFEEEHIDYLLDEEATRDNIFEAFRTLVKKVSENDNIVVYFSGHGYYDEDFNEAYWVPVDATYQKYATYYPYSELKTAIKAIPSRHTFLIVDSCYSGALFVETRDIAQAERFERDPSRWMFASGRNEVVPDGVSGGNSPFSDQLLNTLYRYANEGLRISSLIEKVITATVNNSRQTPIGRPMYDVGDQGGEFFFYPKGAKKGESGERKKKVSQGATYLRPSRLKTKFWYRHPKVVQTILYLLFIAPFIWWVFQPKKKINIDVELQLDRFAFENHFKAGLFYDRELPKVTFQDLKEVTIEADSLQMNQWGDSMFNEYYQLKSPLTIQTETGILSSLSLSSVIFDQFDLPPARLISLEHDETEPDQLHLTFQPNELASIDLQFDQQLHFSAENILMHSGEKEWEDFISPLGRLSMTGNDNGRINIQGHPESNRIRLQIPDSLTISANKLKIGLNEHSFVKRDQEKRFSSLKDGHLYMLSHQGDTIITFPLSSDPDEVLELVPTETLTLSQIELNSKGMKINLKGEVDTVQIAPDLSPRNPSRLWWYWNTRKLELGLIGMGIIGLLALVMGKKFTGLWNVVGRWFGG